MLLDMSAFPQQDYRGVYDHGVVEGLAYGVSHKMVTQERLRLRG